MYKTLLDRYFTSEEYAKTERGRQYLELTEFLHDHLNETDFLDFEVYLHAEIIHTAENAFIAGYTAREYAQAEFQER